MVSILTATIGLISSVIIAIVAKRLKCYFDDLEFIVILHK